MQRMFQTDVSYKEEVQQYGRLDGFLAILVCLISYGALYYTGYLYKAKQIYRPSLYAMLMFAVVLILLVIRRQPISSVGITKYRWKDALRCGGIAGMVLCVLLIIFTGILPGGKLVSGRVLVYDIYKYFIVIALEEEIIFRGYIQTRLHGLMKSEWSVTVVTGIMFALMHIPFQMAKYNMNLFEFIWNDAIHRIMCFLLHIVFTYIYKKYNTIFTGTLIHGFIDFAQSIFI